MIPVNDNDSYFYDDFIDKTVKLTFKDGKKNDQDQIRGTQVIVKGILNREDDRKLFGVIPPNNRLFGVKLSDIHYIMVVDK